MEFYDPGRLTQVVSIQSQPNGGTDSFTAPTWTTVLTCWASVMPTRSAENTSADRMQQSITHTVMVRFTPLIASTLDSAQWRVSFVDRHTQAARVLAIVGPGRNVSSRGQWIVFDCVEGLTDGN